MICKLYLLLICGPSWKRAESKPAPFSFSTSAVRACMCSQLDLMTKGGHKSSFNFFSGINFLLNIFVLMRRIHFLHEKLMFCWKQMHTPENRNITTNWKLSQRASFFTTSNSLVRLQRCYVFHDVTRFDPSRSSWVEDPCWLSHKVESFGILPTPLPTSGGCLDSLPHPLSLKESKSLKDKAKFYFLLCSSPGLFPPAEYTHWFGLGWKALLRN